MNLRENLKIQIIIEIKNSIEKLNTRLYKAKIK